MAKGTEDPEEGEQGRKQKSRENGKTDDRLIDKHVLLLSSATPVDSSFPLSNISRALCLCVLLTAHAALSLCWQTAPCKPRIVHDPAPMQGMNPDKSPITSGISHDGINVPDRVTISLVEDRFPYTQSSSAASAAHWIMEKAEKEEQIRQKPRNYGAFR